MPGVSTRTICVRPAESQTEGVAGLVAGDRRHEDTGGHHHDIGSAGLGTEQPGGEEQRVAGKQEADQQPGLGEDDRPDHQVEGERRQFRQPCLHQGTQGWFTRDHRPEHARMYP